ncbi:EXS family protein [Drepanopeziza brunnea f. sp. 'multigermtubi' MB_m1]|uniref:EXS family protein n=1 Tax=Marssonina brunnea f. sp. multigermtubi (strain MB_m1) TaxID=1072389 RepID=K1Y2X7_MARBU|nr:EXS family protein [Drepanopeziza brunnea f. sp. 'multigermtubi' MB_m1]EKD19509.1 EXS family protein [Drepanopeziza brunnea f. sp. 'multigermtubi' MB_m1]
MKFAKELEQDLVPEWRAKYLDYKVGKKYVKAVSRAQSRMNSTPRTPAPQQKPSLDPQNHSLYGATSFQPRNHTSTSVRRFDGANEEATEGLRGSPAALGADTQPDSENSDGRPSKPSRPTPSVPIPAQNGGPSDQDVKYGSFVLTPPARPSASFELPDPAMEPAPVHDGSMSPRGVLSRIPSNWSASNHSALSRSAPSRPGPVAAPVSAYEVGRTLTPPHRSTFASIRNRAHRSGSVRPFMRRVFSVGASPDHAEGQRLDEDIAMDQVRSRQQEFFKFMDKELEKVETFYRAKEDEAGERLKVLREQLHEMRNRRIDEVAQAQHAKVVRRAEESKMFDFGTKSSGQSKKDDDYRPTSRDGLTAWLDPLERAYGNAKARITGPRPGTNSKALQNMNQSPEMRAKAQAERNEQADDGRDYIRRPHYSDAVPYRTAKRKLKLALQEHYRGMELLKSYALLNRTAFRKINKKYDKAVDAHPPLRFMSEKVNKAWFVNSDVLDSHLHAVEDLYARYFERGNQKIATGKLRSSTKGHADQSASAFRNGVLIGIGAVFSIQGIIHGSELLSDPDPVIRVQTSYLLQIYGGYFLALYLFSWFCLDCSIWTRNKINYQFVFEFDTRHNLDWRQLSEFPSFLILVWGLFVWLNFTRYGAPAMFIYYPVVLIFVTAVVILFPGPYIFHRSRKWFVYSHWRLLLAGLYPVEFRDFFLGDMYCSLTYFMSNIELFFCLYAHYWDNPAQCNSTHSRLLGFFSTLPGIWRALQCLRRYRDTRNVFPHLVNGGKYTMTIVYCVSLSIYRIDRAKSNLAIFITFATINAVYCSIWDLLMDWSLLQPDASKPLLRDVRGYKNPYYYYAAMFLDPIFRFNWIFYAIYTQDLSHSTLVSFLVAFSEVTRRGVWVLFRVENEHCSNVARFKASRDIPLPYSVSSDTEEDSVPTQQPPASLAEGRTSQTSPAVSRLRSHTSATLEAQATPGSSMRHRGLQRSFTAIMANAHTEDFEKRKTPGAGDSDNLVNRRRDGDDEDAHAQGVDSSDEDDEDDAQTILDAEVLLRQGAGGQRG